MSARRLLAVAALQLRLGLRPLVRVGGAVIAGLFLLQTGVQLVSGERLSWVGAWPLVLLVLLVPAFLAGVVRGGDEERAQAVLCPMVMARRRFVLMGVLARTAMLLAVTGLLIGLGRLVAEHGGGEDAGVRQLLALLWVVELATLTAAFSLFIPGEANALATPVLLAGGFVALLERGVEPLPWLLAGLFPIVALPGQLGTAAAGAAALTAAAAAVLALGVREQR